MSRISQDPTLLTNTTAVPVSIYAGGLLAWSGVLIALLLWTGEGAVPSLLCADRGNCETVLASVYSEIRGVPMPVIGLTFYLAQTGLWLAVLAVSSRKLRLGLMDGILGLGIAGLTFSAGLMYVQFGVLHAFCPLCTGSACITGGLLIAAIRARRTLIAQSPGTSVAGAVSLAHFALVSAAAFGVMNLASETTFRGAQLMELSPGHRLGPAEAPVQLSVFSDFQCGFCGQLAPILKLLVEEFPRDVSITYRHFPLASHPRAYAAAIAAECAAEQGDFWAYGQELYSHGGALQEADFLALAAAEGLDQDRFVACLHSDRPEKAVNTNLRDAERVGLEGVPAVFLNGRRLRGALDHDNLARQIRAALAKAPRKG